MHGVCGAFFDLDLFSADFFEVFRIKNTTKIYIKVDRLLYQVPVATFFSATKFSKLIMLISGKVFESSREEWDKLILPALLKATKVIDNM